MIDRISLDPNVPGFEAVNPLKSRLIYFKGGGSGSDNVDEAYNRRMATIAEAQQDMAEDYYSHWERNLKSMEIEQAEANRELIPYETELAKSQAQSETALMPYATSAAQAGYESDIALAPASTEYQLKAMEDAGVAIQEKAPVRTSFYQEALDGVDVESRANKAAADAAQAFMNTGSATNRSAARMGINPSSGRFASAMKKNSLNQAKAIGSAKTQARTGAEQENFGRLATAMNY